MSDELAARQAALIRALVAGASAPTGFDPEDLAAAAHALLRKRAGEVARRYPRLAHACGADFTPLFIAWAAGKPKTTTAADAVDFAQYLDLPAPLLGRASKRARWSSRR
ncbi:hypothetical protein F5X71_35350 [Nocardia brasiliensis]|uniref:SCO6045-like C-terminal domain-containing protein n=1 Tax=Nocardia brasiliensis TaxID=37326 RepID=A0A6G9Y128_NOCBR|nr:hypothetical protein [Nocardia brasiliensis]QIS06891.1 hypothetical protein F5X71_35350 [Nocardia brasiliensis]